MIEDGDWMRLLVVLVVIFSLSLFAQTLYFSPNGDLALTVYDPFITVKPTNPNEIGVFKVLTSNSILQILSVSLPQSTDLITFSKLIGMQLVAAEETANGLVKIDELQVFYRKFSLSASNVKSEAFQIVFVKFQRGFVMTYYSTQEDFHKYLVPALLSMSSIKIASIKQEYLNEKFRYSVNLIEPFEAIEPVQDEIGSFIAIEGSKVGYIQIVSEELPKKLNIEEYAKSVEKNSLANLSDYRELSKGKNLVQGEQFYWRIFQFSSNKVPYKCLQAHILLSNSAFTLTYMAKVEDFDQFIFPAVYTIFSFRQR